MRKPQRGFSGIIGLSFLIFLLAAPGLPQEKKALSFDDFIRLKRISDPQLSPDGKWVALVITEMNPKANSSESDIWLIPSTGGELRRLTTSPKPDFSPRWSPDGRLAFISSREGSPQVWIIDLRGGEATPLTSLPTGVSAFAWSPRGSHLVVASNVFPDTADPEETKKRLEEREKSPVKARVYDHLLFRHWNSWWDGTRSHLFLIPLNGEKIIDLTPGDYDTPPIALGGTADFAFSPEGAEVCFVRNVDPELRLGLGTNNDLFLVPTGGGDPKKITSNQANDNQPLYSPDGRYIAYRAMARPGFEADKYDLMLFDRRTSEIIPLTRELDYSVEEILWSPDSSSLYFTAEEKGRIAVFRVILPSKGRLVKIEKILSGHYVTNLLISPDGRKIYFLNQALNRPADLWSCELATGKLVQLTDVNRSLLERLELPPAEEFWFDGAGGEKVHGFLLRPPFFDPSRRYPLVMLIHGGPQSAWSDNFHYRWNAQMFASRGLAVAMINFHGSTGYGQKFTDSISGDWGGKPFEDIMLGLDYLLKTYPFLDGEKTAAAGASYGGYMINWLEGHTDRFRCLISHAGVFDLRSMYGATEELWFPEWDLRGTPWSNPELYEKFSPSAYVKNFKTPCLVTHGENDFRVPVTQALQFFTSLQRMGVPSKLVLFPDEDHFVQKPRNAEFWWQTVLDWLEKYLK